MRYLKDLLGNLKVPLLKQVQHRVFLFLLICLIIPQTAKAGIYINNIPYDISITEGEPLDVPVFFGAENLTGKDIELYIWKENLDGSGKDYFSGSGWFPFSQLSQITPVLQFGPMFEYFYGYWRAYENTLGMKSFSLNICMDGEMDNRISQSPMCGKRNVIIKPPVNNCTGIYLSQSSISQTIDKGQSKSIDITVKDSCGNIIDFNATKNQSWLTLSQQKGLLRVTIQTSTLSAGTYTDTIRVTSGNETKNISVSLTVKNPTISFFPIGSSCTPSSINPWPVSITAATGETKTQTVEIKNNCGNPVSYTAQVISGSNWLSASTSGNGSMTVTVRTTGLSAGTYNGQIRITSGSLTGLLDVNLTVTGPCEPNSAVIDPLSISRSIQVGQGLGNITVSIKNNCGTALNYTVNSVNGYWITSPQAGQTGSGSLTLSFNTANLSAGSYSGSVTVTPEGYSAKTINISLSVSTTPPPSGNLTQLTTDNTRLRFSLEPGRYRYFYFYTASNNPNDLSKYQRPLTYRDYLEVRLEPYANYYTDGRDQQGDLLVRYAGPTCDGNLPSIDDLLAIKAMDWRMRQPSWDLNSKTWKPARYKEDLYYYMMWDAFEAPQIAGDPHYPLGCYYILVYNNDNPSPPYRPQTSDLYISFREYAAIYHGPGY